MFRPMLTGRTKVRRHADRGSNDADVVHAILDSVLVCHVGFVDAGQPYVIPTMHARIGDRLYLHGAVANRMLGILAEGAPCSVTATALDGLVLARSAMHHSMNYRSAVVLGTAVPVLDPAEKNSALRALIERVRPGRWAVCRPPNDAELAATRVLCVPITEASAKVRNGPPVDSASDLSLPFWAGVIPLRVVQGEPEPDPSLAPGIPFPHARTTASRESRTSTRTPARGDSDASRSRNRTQ